MVKYDPLRDHLARSAGRPSSELQATAWWDAGRRVAEVNLGAGRVWFGRG